MYEPYLALEHCHTRCISQNCKCFRRAASKHVKGTQVSPVENSKSVSTDPRWTRVKKKSSFGFQIRLYNFVKLPENMSVVHLASLRWVIEYYPKRCAPNWGAIHKLRHAALSTWFHLHPLVTLSTFGFTFPVRDLFASRCLTPRTTWVVRQKNCLESASFPLLP